MANEKVNKVVLGNETLIDLTGDTVTANSLLAGATAHDNRGEQIQGAVSVPEELNDLDDVNLSSPALGDSLFHDGTEWVNKNLMVEVTKAEYDALVSNNEDDPNVDYHITDIDVAEAYYVETSGQTALTGATSLTFTNSHIKPTADIRILAEPASCKVSTNPQYKVSAKLSSVGSGTATITFPALAENTTFWLLIECPLPITVDPAYVYNTDETVIGQWIDGRPIYRRTFVGTLNPSDTVTNVSTLPNVGGSDILSMQVVVSKRVGTIEFALTTFAGANIGAGDYLFPIYYVANGLQIHTGNTDYRGANYRLVVEYTKTTD